MIRRESISDAHGNTLVRHALSTRAVRFNAGCVERLTELQPEMPAATIEILERESKDYLADVELFLEAECGNSPCRSPQTLLVQSGRHTSRISQLIRLSSWG